MYISGIGILSIKDSGLESKNQKQMRRADRLSQMAVAGACEALDNSGLKLEDIVDSLSIIVATGLGPNASTFKFLDTIIDYGDIAASPTIFSHSVHNAAASYISQVLGAKGQCLTVTQFEFSFIEALKIAESWLAEGRCKYILLGSVEETCDVMELIFSEKMKEGDSKRYFEESVFFLLSNESIKNKSYCKISTLFKHDNMYDFPAIINNNSSMAFDCAKYTKLTKNNKISKVQVIKNQNNGFQQVITLEKL